MLRNGPEMDIYRKIDDSDGQELVNRWKTYKGNLLKYEFPGRVDGGSASGSGSASARKHIFQEQRGACGKAHTQKP